MVLGVPDDSEEKVLLVLLPFVVCEFELFEADEFEHAALGSGAGDHG